VDALERELRSLKSSVRKDRIKKRWWAHLAGSFKDDAVFDEIVEAGRKYRRSLSRRSNGSHS